MAPKLSIQRREEALQWLTDEAERLGILPVVPAQPETALHLRACVAEIAKWTDARDRAIRQAMNEGASAREVGALAGISHTWVLKIWRDEG